MEKSRHYITAILTLVAAIVGVGMFTLPYVTVQAGIIPVGIFFIALAIIQHWLHKLYAEVVLSSKDQHRLPGYAGIYLGPKSKKLLTVLTMIASYGSLLAYTLIGGDFLHQLLAPYFGGSVFFYTTMLLLLRGGIIFLGFKWVTRTEAVLTGGLIGTMVVVAALTIGSGEAWSIASINPGNFFLPYGPIFFALNGVVAVNEVCIILKNEKQRIAGALRWGMIIAVSIMMMFTALIISLSGEKTTADALSGLGPFIDPAMYVALLIVGLVTVTTSFLIVAGALEEMYIWDFKINRTLAWLLTVFIPYALYIIGAHDITAVVAITGTISGGLLGAMSLNLALKVKQAPQIKPPFHTYLTRFSAYGLSSLFFLGALYQLWELLR